MEAKELSIAVKTHLQPENPKKKHPFRKAVVIIRNPFDCLIAFYQFRRTKGHIGVISEDQFESEGEYFTGR